MYLDILSYRQQANQVLQQVPSTPIRQILSPISLHSPISVSSTSTNPIPITPTLHYSHTPPLILQDAVPLYNPDHG